MSEQEEEFDFYLSKHLRGARDSSQNTVDEITSLCENCAVMPSSDVQKALLSILNKLEVETERMRLMSHKYACGSLR